MYNFIFLADFRMCHVIIWSTQLREQAAFQLNFPLASNVSDFSGLCCRLTATQHSGRTHSTVANVCQTVGVCVLCACCRPSHTSFRFSIGDERVAVRCCGLRGFEERLLWQRITKRSWALLWDYQPTHWLSRNTHTSWVCSQVWVEHHLRHFFLLSSKICFHLPVFMHFLHFHTEKTWRKSSFNGKVGALVPGSTCWGILVQNTEPQIAPYERGNVEVAL